MFGAWEQVAEQLGTAGASVANTTSPCLQSLHTVRRTICILQSPTLSVDKLVSYNSSHACDDRDSSSSYCDDHAYSSSIDNKETGDQEEAIHEDH